MNINRLNNSWKSKQVVGIKLAQLAKSLGALPKSLTKARV